MTGKTNRKWTALAAAVVIATMNGCGGDGSTSTSTSTTTGVASNPTADTVDVVVERGPLMKALVEDANGMRATEIAAGRYQFRQQPTWPIKAVGGYIDVNRNGTLDSTDVAMGTLQLRSRTQTATLLATMAENEALHQALLDLGLTDEQIFSRTPSEDKTVAAVSDEIYKYCVTQNIEDPATLTVDQLNALQAQIQQRIQSYENDSRTVAELEQILVEQELAGHVHHPDQTEIERVSTTANTLEATVYSLPTYDLSLEQKATIAYMWDEERMARDLYRALYQLFPNAKPLNNIAENSETQHVQWVTTLVEKYDLNLFNTTDYSGGYDAQALSDQDAQAGSFLNADIQALYDALYAEGSQSEIDALKVGCKVEVTDVNDLDADIQIAGDALDIVATYEQLRAGSYNHYWAFDNALKQRGVAEGCCSLGAEFCHPEYPQLNSGGGRR